MMKSAIIIGLLLIVLMSACSPDENNNDSESEESTEVVHDFFTAYRDENLEQLQTLTCAGSEDKLNISADYLDTVSSIHFEDLAFTETEHTGDQATVHTEGTIYFTDANGDEQNTFSLDIILRQVNGVWCLTDSIDPTEQEIELPTPMVIPTTES
jgi:hypothetical protein